MSLDRLFHPHSSSGSISSSRPISSLPPTRSDVSNGTPPPTIRTKSSWDAIRKLFHHGGGHDSADETADAGGG